MCGGIKRRARVAPSCAFAIPGALTLALTLTLLAASSCARQPTQPELVHPATNPNAATIVLLKSSDNPLLEPPITAFINQVNSEVVVYTLSKDTHAADLVEEVRKRTPQLILTFGTPATKLARAELADLPLLFTMVLNYRRLQLDGNNVMGIAMEPATQVEFLQFTMVAPNLRKVLTFYKPDVSGPLVEEAKSALAPLEIELVTVPVESPADVEEAYAANIAAVDGVWLINDPVMVKAFKYLRDRTLGDKKMFATSLSEGFAKAGALMSVSVDFRSVGSQAAAIARTFLEQDTRASDIGIQKPMGVALVVNEKTANTIGLDIPPEVRPFISRLLTEAELSKK